jgi:SAM-dependent methyltransferase
VPTTDLSIAAKVWDDPDEPLEQVNDRIHDGVPRHLLDARADGYAAGVLEKFAVNLPSRPAILEAGSGTGYVMEAIDRRLVTLGNPAGSITGLDIAPSMIEKARQRLGSRPPFRFQLYDGVTVPLPDESLDLVYSVATLQHIPKPFVYSLFLEVKRLLKPEGSAVFHLMPFRNLHDWKVQGQPFSWKDEIRQQVEGRVAHWHHFYSAEELEMVLVHGSGFARFEIDERSEIWLRVGKTPATPGRQSTRRRLEHLISSAGGKIGALLHRRAR